MPLVSLIPSLLYPRIGVPLTPLYYLPPPLLQLLLTLLTSLNILQQTFVTFRLLRLNYS